MLKQLLREIANNGGSSHAHLAQRLDISATLLEQMLEDLARKGYLAPVMAPAVCTGCSGCRLRQTCTLNASPPTAESQGWILTPKGRRCAETTLQDYRKQA
ncbi:MAG: winged helix-turn-helix transcriptional regulator [Anaerolineae bacterium]|nr:winged helix-turn-helix transcriptional regulator [Anaerolineae bacterium]